MIFKLSSPHSTCVSFHGTLSCLLLQPSPYPPSFYITPLFSSTQMLHFQNPNHHSLAMSAAVAAAAAAALCNSSTASSSENNNNNLHLYHHHHEQVLLSPSPPQPLSRYESQKRRDWNTFGQYLRNHKPPLALSRCSGAHVLEFLRYLDQFGKTKVHNQGCPFFGHPHPPAPCPCPLKQAWGSLDALIGRLRAAFEENGGLPETNPFGARAVRLFLREVRDEQSKARGIAYEKKKRKKPMQQPPSPQQQLQLTTSSSTYVGHVHGICG